MSKQYDMAATGWEEFPGPAWEKGKWGIGQIEATGQWGLGVKSAHRGEGIGRALIKEAMIRGVYSPDSNFSKGGAKTVISAHREILADALSRGLPVPPEVLADYPDLAKKYAKSAEGHNEGHNEGQSQRNVSDPAPDIVTDLIQTGRRAIREFRGRISGVKYGPVQNGEDAILFDLDGVPHRGVLKGRNAELVMGSDPEANKAMAARIFLAGDAAPVNSPSPAPPAENLPAPEPVAVKGEGKIKPPPKGHEAEYQVTAEKAEPMLDIRRKPTGWKMVETDRGRVLLSPDGSKVVRFEAEKGTKSGAAVIRQRAEAQAWAMDNPLTAEPRQQSEPGEIVTRPIYDQAEPGAGEGLPAPVQKQPWEMTRAEREDAVIAQVASTLNSYRDGEWHEVSATKREAIEARRNGDLYEVRTSKSKKKPAQFNSAEDAVRHVLNVGVHGESLRFGHERAVDSALYEGKPVPPEVLADYPDLAKKYAKGGESAQSSEPLKTGDRVHLSGGDRFHDDVSGVVYDVKNGGDVLEVVRDGTDYPVRVNVADYKSQRNEPAQNRPAPPLPSKPESVGLAKPDLGKLRKSRIEGGGVEGQKNAAATASRVSILMSMNEKVAEVNPSAAYDEASLGLIPVDRIDEVRDYLIQKYNETTKKSPPSPAPPAENLPAPEPVAVKGEGKAKEPVSLNEDRERKARETKRTSEERSAAAIESIAASLAKIADQPSGIPMTAEDARARLGMKKPEHPVNIAPEGEPPIFRKAGEPAPETMTTADALAFAKTVGDDWQKDFIGGNHPPKGADLKDPPTNAGIEREKAWHYIWAQLRKSVFGNQ